MKMLEFYDQVQTILDRACPELKLSVVGDHTQLNILHSLGRISYHFCIDKTEWEKSKWPEHIVRMRLLETLTELRNHIDRTIKEIE